jgi:hypothetical protein
MAGKKNRSGGARKGSGPKPKPKERNYSDEFKDAVVKYAKELAIEYKEPIEKAFLRMMYDDDVQDTVKSSIFKVYAEVLLVKETKKDVNIKGELKPMVIGLPEKQPDPAKLIPIKGGKK